MFLTFDTVEAFAVTRNPSLSFPFLKENGELLSIAVSAGFLIEPRALNLYKGFYDKAYMLTAYYPQYYRFTLAMALDLEACGMEGSQGQKIADYVLENNLVTFDTSDVRRLETLSLLVKTHERCETQNELYEGILKRVDNFFKTPEWFMKFNKPLFYDLTHIIYFITDYGKTALPTRSDPLPCLHNVGLLALLDNDADLLSEVCLCLRYLGQAVPPYWDDYLTGALQEIGVTFDGNIASALNPTVDEYHLYLVSNAYMAVRENIAFKDRFKSRAPSFKLKDSPPSILEKLSDYAYSAHNASRSLNPNLHLFAATLNDDESLHWKASLASHPQSLEVLEKFSNLS